MLNTRISYPCKNFDIVDWKHNLDDLDFVVQFQFFLHVPKEVFQLSDDWIKPPPLKVSVSFPKEREEIPMFSYGHLATSRWLEISRLRLL